MQSQIWLGRIMGIRVGLHYSWFLIAFLILTSLVGQFQHIHPEWGAATIWTTAGITAVLFFASLLAHEMSHAAVARSRGLPIRAITLFALGGVAQIEKEADDPRTEFWMAVVGPLASFAIGAVSLALAWGLGGAVSPVGAMFTWLGYINVTLAVFNLIPGFPLDGGRILRAALWWRGGDEHRATRVASQVGQAVGMGLIAWGFTRFLLGGAFGGLWLALIGWFLLEAARESYAMTEFRERLRGVRVADLMRREWDAVDPRTPLSSFVQDRLLRTGRRCFVVEDEGGVKGLITPHEVKQVEQPMWPVTPVGQVMRPLDEVKVVTPDMPVSEPLRIMTREDVNQLPVVSAGRVVGVISRGDLLSFLQTKSELGV